ncbi:DJ-1/PfpI family protein [Nesterenkonia xinjiangensis]|uniref:Cyclohexyl-isocyanide hydratase n=1 Tax=Nesterenkonia xinjiangensis TaxID=225327 RepID=A0A7Z0K8X0_9MICC|nr:DJ-1/PfpI family protein [Nesterenkonia xinjiangensis]NYJ78124.1 cyclohexyl-isocyanide hydratase [Nesterenkonia xinjiangensis]
MSDPFRIVALLFPHVTQLDFTGPAQVFSKMPGAELHVAWHREEPVPTDAGFSILPTTTLEAAPQADVLFVPGGRGAFELLEDEVMLDFLRRQAAEARWITGVCTGSFLLGAAGLLRGRRATSHWGSLHLLERLGATPVAERVVRDDHVITAAGVSAGIDFALRLTAEIYGDDVAKRLQLQLEYDPEPPFDAGAPSRPDADDELANAQIASMTELRGDVVDRAAARLDAG